jgi:hypothetical protein
MGRDTKGVMHGLDVRRIIENAGHHHWAGAAANVNPERLVELLAYVTTGPNPAARTAKQLLRDMQYSPWHVAAGVHAGGREDAEREPDQRSHITLEVGRGERYHIRFSHDMSRVVGIS